MKKILLVLAAFSFFGCQDIINLDRPEDSLYLLDGISSPAERMFVSFWTGMNHNYVFWDIDPTDWDRVYREFRPKFAALDDLEDEDEIFQRLYEYFTAVTWNLIDGHFSMELDLLNIDIVPSMNRFLERIAQEGIALAESEYIEDQTNLMGLLIASPLFSERSYHQTEAFVDAGDFSVFAGKIPFSGGQGGSILYLYFSEFIWSKIFENTDPYLAANEATITAIWDYFMDNLYAPDVKGVIVDVRGNGGGRISDLSYLWGQMFSREQYHLAYNRQKMGDGRMDHSPLLPFYIFNDPENTRDLQVPLVILTNKFSASCAEMSTLFVRSLPNGHHVGGTTWGAMGGITDNVFFNAGSFSSIGIELTFTPSVQVISLNGTNYEGRGIPPDHPVPFNFAEFNRGRDTRLEKAIEVVVANQ